MKHYVIIGASAAGIAAAESIRHHDKKSKIVMVSEENELPYFRVMLSFVLAGSFAGEKLAIRPGNYFKELGISLVTGKKALGIDALRNQVFLDDNSRVNYDALLLATGSRPRPLNVPGLDKKGVYYFRTRKDMQGVQDALKDTQRAVVIGGGLVGIKVADALCDRGVKVTMMVTSDKVLSQTADIKTADIVLNILKDRGMEVRRGVSPAQFQGKGERVEIVVADKGEPIPCQLVVIGKGVLPNSWLAGGISEQAQEAATAGTGKSAVAGDNKSETIDTGHGIKTDRYLATTVPNIFTAGDAAQTLDIATGKPEIHAIWPAAVEQGKIAGCNMCGKNIPYGGTINRNAFHIGSSYVVTGGLFNPEPDDDCEIHVNGDAKNNVHHRIVTRGDHIVGMSFVNDTPSAGIVLAMIQRKHKISSLPADIFSPGFDFSRLKL